MMNQVLRNWAQTDSKDALAWAKELPDGKLKDRAIMNVVASVGDADPREAAKLIPSLPPQSQDDATGNLAGRWARNDPTAAAQWTTTLPESDARSKAARNIVETWAEQDPNKTAGWLQKLPAGLSRDAAVGEFSRRFAGADPAGAAAWAATIYDPEQRENAIAGVYKKWVQRDQQGALAFIANSQVISIDLKQRLLAPFKGKN